MFKYGQEPRCLKCKPLLIDRIESDAEIEIFEFMKSVPGSKYKCIRNEPLNWNLLNADRKQLDIICCRKKDDKPMIAIEFDGCYWHSLEYKRPGYHLQKTKLCESLGIRLVHIWEDEWLLKKDAIKVFLASLLKDESVDIVPFTKSSLESSLLQIDRSKICKLLVPQDYKIVGETSPEVIIRTGDKKSDKYPVEDCGYLICERLVKKNEKS